MEVIEMNKYKSKKIKYEHYHLKLAEHYSELMEEEFKDFTTCCKKHYENDEDLFRMLEGVRRDIRYLKLRIEVCELLYEKESD